MTHMDPIHFYRHNVWWTSFLRIHLLQYNLCEKKIKNSESKPFLFVFHPENDPGVKLPNDCKSKHLSFYLLHGFTSLVPINMSKTVLGKSLIRHFKPFLKFFQIIGVSPLKIETCEECDYETVKPFNLCLHLMLLSNSFSSTVKWKYLFL